MGIRDWIDALSETKELDEAKKKRKRKARRKKPVYGGAAPWYSGFVGSGECGDAVTESEDDENLTLHQQYNVAWAAAKENPTPENIAEFRRLDALWSEEGRRQREQDAAMPSQAQASDSYRGEHEAPDHENGAALHDLTMNSIYPDDVYGARGPEYSDHYHSVAVFRNRPNARVTIYRAVPRDPAIKRINPGDWVTPFRRYAVEHGRDNLRNDYKIMTKTVFARDLFTDGGSLEEWGYDPQPPVRTARPGRP